MSLLGRQAAWRWQTPGTIAEGLLQTLRELLALDLVAVYLKGEDEVASHPADAPSWAALREAAASEQSVLWQGVEHRLALVDLPDDRGALIAGSARASFPSPNEQMLIRIAAEQAALSMQASSERQAREQLAEENRRKDEFLAMLGHELRNPLATLFTGLELLGAEAATEDCLPMLLRQARHLSHLIDDLLDVARLSRDRIELRTDTVDLRRIVERAVATVPLLEERGHQVDLRLPSGPMVMDGDPVRLEQVVAILLRNAAQYSPTPCQIEVGLERVNDVARLRVRDAGVGLDPRDLERIFELFQQGPTELARTSGGLGIGLTIAARLVALHRGRIWAQSEGLGCGTKMIVELPMQPARSEPRETEKPELTPSTALRILVVDDNVDAAEMIAALLERLGHHVSIANDGVHALAQAEATAPQLIFLDIGLPQIDGYEVARRLRSTGTSCTLAALTGYGQERDKTMAFEAGFDHHLVKPASAAQIRAVIDDAARRIA